MAHGRALAVLLALAVRGPHLHLGADATTTALTHAHASTHARVPASPQTAVCAVPDAAQPPPPGAAKVEELLRLTASSGGLARLADDDTFARLVLADDRPYHAFVLLTARKSGFKCDVCA